MGIINSAKVNADGSTNVVVLSGGGGSSGTVAPTTAGTTATTANPIQGVTGGVAVPVSAASLPLPTGASQDGVDATGVAAPAGGSGLRGWLSGMYSKLSGLSFDGSSNLKVNIVTGSVSNTVAATSAGTPSTTANPVQGVTGGVPFPVSGAFFQATQPVSGTVSVVSSGSTTTPNVTQLSDATTPTQRVAVSAAGALKVDNSSVTQPVSNTALTNLQFDGSNSLKVNVVTGATLSNTVAATAAGTTATTANPIQGVTGGVALSVSSNVQIAGSPVSASNAFPVVTVASGIGVDTAFPTTISAAGTSLGVSPTGGRGLIIHLSPGSSISAYVASTVAASSSAAATVAQSYANPASSTSFLDLQFNLFGTNQVWVTNVSSGSATSFVSGLPIYRFV